MKKISTRLITVFVCCMLFSACADERAVTMQEVIELIQSGATAAGVDNRVLIVDVRSSGDFIQGHIQDALSVPLSMIAHGTDPLYTNGYNEVSPTAAEGIKNSWLAHMLINQLTNDFASTYQDAQIIFYAAAVDDAVRAADIAAKAGYTDISYLAVTYEAWAAANTAYIKKYCEGIASVDEANGSFIMSGYINNTNFQNVSGRGMHHGIIFEGGGLHNNGLLQVTTPPFCFQELLTFLGASPEGNMAEGIDFGTMDQWAAKYPDGEKIEYSVTWDGAAKYYTLDEVYEEKPSGFQPDPSAFRLVGFEARIGGTRDSNMNWNPGCIFCFYACVCGITSNAKANENTWFADGGTYDETTADTNFFAGRYYPRMDILPGEGTPVKIKVQIPQ